MNLLGRLDEHSKRDIYPEMISHKTAMHGLYRLIQTASQRIPHRYEPDLEPDANGVEFTMNLIQKAFDYHDVPFSWSDAISVFNNNRSIIYNKMGEFHGTEGRYWSGYRGIVQ